MWRISSNWTGHGSLSVDLQESGQCFHTRYSCTRERVENAIKSVKISSVSTRIPCLMDAVRDMMKRSNPLLVIRVCGFVFYIEIELWRRGLGMKRFVRLHASSFVTQSRTIKARNKEMKR
ncbi:Uncharacterized protein APZ42_026873 [Daphnia magna]|uniref:Uncharacterized protein n=1 Tax=Daphnia magna TaxID=35525 RepID=A0A162ECT3_9CRUS|nr:Uncharacterized protein APZ42_026873 [Daphnia magna]